MWEKVSNNLAAIHYIFQIQLKDDRLETGGIRPVSKAKEGM